MTVEPKPQFRDLTEEAVLQALADPDPQNPVTIELSRLIMAYTKNFCRHVERLGYMPPHILHMKALATPIAAVAIRLTTETIRETVLGVRSPPH